MKRIFISTATDVTRDQAEAICRRTELYGDVIPIAPRLGLSWAQTGVLRMGLLAGCDEIHAWAIDGKIPPEVQTDIDLATALGKFVELNHVTSEELVA